MLQLLATAPDSCCGVLRQTYALLGSYLPQPLRVSLPHDAALHVASATGRADVVRQLAAAGAGLNKALPMDYRALLRQAGQAQQVQQAQQGQQAQQAQQAVAADGQQSDEDAAAEAGEAFSDQDGCEDELCGGWGGAAAAAEGRAPPPKRGRYVTAGPAAPGPPSLQYCTALHCAALGGHLEAVQALLSTGEVGGWGRGC